MKPDELFKISDTEVSKLPEKDNVGESSSNKKTEEVEDIKPKKKETTIDDLMSFMKDNKIQADQKSIENYYNQIVENKKYINQYNQEINAIENSKNESSGNKQGGGAIPDQIKNKLSDLESKLAELNTSKREKEDEIKSTINNIFKENKSENNQNVSFETKNSFLNLVMQDSQKEEKTTPQELTQKKEENKETTPQELPQKKEDNKETSEFLGEKESDTKKETSEFLGEKESDTKKENIEKNENVSENPIPIEKTSDENIKTEDKPSEPFSDLKKEENKENVKESSGFSEKTSNESDSFSKLSQDMQKGFESILNAIKGIPSSQQKEKAPEQKEETPQKQQQEAQKPQENRPKTAQKNYIDEYRETLRSNAPLKGYVGIKGMQLKANNIGSYV